MKILAMSGSLRSASLNTALLKAVAKLAPEDISIQLFENMGDLPLFNPDLEETPQPIVENLLAQLLAADAVLIASPEYAHGVTGVMKNALDWMVSRPGFVDKPVALLNASPRAVHAHAALAEILTTMSARIVKEASITVPLQAVHDEAAIIVDPEISSSVIQALQVLQSTVEDLRQNISNDNNVE
jgi:NAD(P)H-dependent FMN reductase